MKLILKKRVFLPVAIVDFIRIKMDACVFYAQAYAKSIDIPDRYASGDNIQKLATYLHNCGALSDKDAEAIVKKSRFDSIEELVDYWRSDVDELIDAEGFE